MRSRKSVGALLLVFLVAHLALLPRTLEDLDSINFALGVRQFDVARHQPHPPGYPVFIAAAKFSTATLRAIGISAPAPRGLAIWSAIGGALALPALLLFWSALEDRRRVAWWATVVIAAAPLYWFTALRPLSDMFGFAAAIWAMAFTLASASTLPASTALQSWSPDRRLIAGALIAGVAAGIRSQTTVLTVPLLLSALVVAREVSPRGRLLAIVGFVVGGVAWGVPMLIVSGGPTAYVHALGAQAGEDFSGVVMLWTHHSPRAIAAALANTFVWPWDWALGIGICVLAAIGVLRVAWRAPRAILWVAVAFVPYGAFHLLFQETETVRYALPLLPPIAYFAVASLETRGKVALPLAAVAIAVASLSVALPASATYAVDGAPIFRAFDDMATTAHGGEGVDTIAMHAGARRAAEWSAPIMPARVAKAPHGKEWQALLTLWRAEPRALVWFAADPRRTDLALFDRHDREIANAYRWGFTEPPFVGGARPDNIDWYRLRPPGWMLDRGWSVTAEVGGVTAREHLGPQVAPATAWIRSSGEEMTLLIGGRRIGGASDARVTLTLRAQGSPLASWDLAPGFFMRVVPVPAGALQGTSPYVPLEVAATSAAAVPVSLEQFDVQGRGVPMVGFDQGWQEPEYNPALGRAWRWMSERAVLWVRPVGRPVTLKLTGESPLKYYKEAPHIRVLVGDREISSFDPSSDFDQSVVLPADALAQAGGRVTLESSKFFVPGGSSGGGDQRHLAIRMFAVDVE